jgi:predicted nucleic acid-binding protein
MGREALNQTEAWEAYDRWLEDERVSFLPEPPELEDAFRALSRLPRPAPKDWADSYLAAFASTSNLTLVTFDRAVQGKTKQLVILKP